MRNTLLLEGDVPTMTSMHRISTATRLRLSVAWLRRRFLLLVGALAAALAVAGTAYYWSSARFVVSTDDAYVQADSTRREPMFEPARRRSTTCRRNSPNRARSLPGHARASPRVKRHWS
jgi:hypothetical protein